ncbi:MAG: Maf family protein [Anaerolineae bacterium]
MTATFILGSSSPRRRELIASLGINFTIIKPDIDESLHAGESALDYVRRLSREKAAAIAAKVNADATILAADTVVILAADTMGIADDGEILGKPADHEEARAMLRRLRSRPHQVCTAITLANVGKTGEHSAAPLQSVTRTMVHMRDYSDAEIETYIASGDPFDKAGGYAIQHEGFRPVARIDGCYNNVVGLPLCAVKRGLAQLGWPGIRAPQDCDCVKYQSS